MPLRLDTYRLLLPGPSGLSSSTALAERNYFPWMWLVRKVLSHIHLPLVSDSSLGDGGIVVQSQKGVSSPELSSGMDS